MVWTTAALKEHMSAAWMVALMEYSRVEHLGKHLVDLLAASMVTM